MAPGILAVPARIRGRTSYVRIGLPILAAMKPGSIPGLTAKFRLPTSRVRLTTTVSLKKTGSTLVTATVTILGANMLRGSTKTQ